ncbi:MAG: hypothetical protein NVSMB32_17390 [Actinomycetota bacterium]
MTFHGYGVALDAAAEPGSDSFKVLVDSADTTIAVTLSGMPSPNTATKLCPIIDLTHGSSIAACVTPANGIASQIPHGSAFKGVHVFQTSGSGRFDITVSYSPSDRKTSLLLPNIAPQPGASACKDNGCNPFFELTPRRSGPFTASATWSAIASAVLDMETGHIAEHDYSAHGTPYNVVATASGSSDSHAASLHIAGSLDATTQAALALRNQGARLLRSPMIEISWP